MRHNTLLATDTYKLGHATMYAEGMTTIYSNMVARSTKRYSKNVFFGLQMILMDYLVQPITKEDAQEFHDIRAEILGPDTTGEMTAKINNLAELGYWPVEIKAVPEGTVVEGKNVILSIRNTLPEFYWTVGFLESLLLKVWATSTVCTFSKKLRTLGEKYADMTCNDRSFVPFQFHDFGYRGVSSEESAMKMGMAVLVNSLGTDTVPAVWGAKHYYAATSPIGLSVPATEHSVVCTFEKANEVDYFRYQMKKHPTGILSLVSDTWDYWHVLENILPQLKEEILARDGKVVIRPDSGNPERVILGYVIPQYDSLYLAKSIETTTSIEEAQHSYYDESEKLDIIEKAVLVNGQHYRLKFQVKYETDLADDVEYVAGVECISEEPTQLTAQEKGSLRVLEEIFGSTRNEKGFRELNPKIGLIYGDGMYFDRINRVFEGMMDMWFASNNIVFGIGGILLQNHSRDDAGYSLKATYGEKGDHGFDMFKDPATDPKKKSFTGRCRLMKDEEGVYYTEDKLSSWTEEAQGELETVFKDGIIWTRYTFEEVRANAAKGFIV